MLNIIWPIFIIVSIAFAIFTGNIQNINNSIFESTETAIKLTLTLLGTMCLWNGIMQIAIKTSATQRITNFLKPIIKFLFPKIDKDSRLYQEISMNIVANVLGLGNAATPLRNKSNEDNAGKK